MGVPLLFAIVVLLNGCGNSNSNSKVEFKVWGNCGMCEETIEGSLKVDGISDAEWDKDTKLMKVSFDSTKISLDQIQKKIADVGYDNDKYKADDSAYNKLHECCQYERKQ
ncbi:MAG: heavy-metal-associated domain-containing protein [Bacteroidetes bacterium]|nr:heavy-metal-associated domain-containing protein [Bacteroidota bacterium]